MSACFGLRDMALWAEWKRLNPETILLENASHTPFSYGAADADFSFGSLRKWLPLPDGGFVSAKNPAEMFRRPASSMPDFAADFLAASLARTQENGEKDGCEFRRAGNVYRVETLIASGSWFETYNTFALLLTFTDITQESRSADIRSEFFANASHELKTPLTVIKGYSELLTLPGQSGKNISRCVSEIQTNADKMGVLINDMLFISRLDANIVNEEKATVDLGGMCRSICDDMGGAAQNAGVTIFCEGDGTAECYPKMMTTAITNLVSNAVKYNREGGSVWVKVHEDGEYVCISVKDNGIGISDEDKPRVFERFFKADKAHTRNDELSTGLGLAIVKHIIVNMHGGEITLESEEGKGSEFIVKLAKGKEAEKNDISDETQTGN